MSASKAAEKRLAREYKSISENPPPYIEAHPSDANILEWHYIITGPENTPYHGGQYWGTLTFPTNYPFAPPAIRMITPSGRFQPATRLCLSISDFHPKSFNPAWSVSTILIGLLSFMTSDEITTGSISSTSADRRTHASRTRWWNSTGGGSNSKCNPATSSNNNNGNGNGGLRQFLRSGDGGNKFRSEWPEIDAQNWEWMKEHKVDLATGISASPPSPAQGGNSKDPSSCGPQLGIGSGNAAAGSAHQGRAVVDAVVQQRDAGTGWLHKNKLLVFGAAVFLYVMIARVLGNGD